MKNWFLRTFIYKHHYDSINLFAVSMPFNTVREMNLWAREHFEKNSFKILTTYYRYIDDRAEECVKCFCFKKKEDLVTFKMNWI